MSNQPVIIFNQVVKRFNLTSQKTFKEFLPALFLGEKTHHSFTAVNDVSFSINHGETIGIIGPNGSGKSTILKLVAGVMSPTSGKLIVRGKVSPLIELGAGFHPELSGKENIYLNGAILGLRRKEIDSYYQNILDFSELKDFIDQPIKHYSSGMYMRLAFAVAVHVNPEILIVDEILAVGDAPFQAKCVAKMDEFKKRGITILYVSHSLQSVKTFCSRALYFRHGQLLADGSSTDICQQYQNDQ
jgi:ABC-type polysaccharide/polyol phosphate transport system ATPase subunit